MKKNQHQGSEGFTVVELIVVIAIMAILMAIVTTGFYSFQNSTSLGLAVSTTAQAVRRAEIEAEAVDGDSPWGVHIASNTLTLFKGASYASRTSGADIVFNISGPTISGLTDIVFNKLTGYPQQTGTITFTGVDGNTKSLSINAKGEISY